jgi:hypothetical protein
LAGLVLDEGPFFVFKPRAGFCRDADTLPDFSSLWCQARASRGASGYHLLRASLGAATGARHSAYQEFRSMREKRSGAGEGNRT